MEFDYKTFINFMEKGQYPYCILDASDHEISFLISEDTDAAVRNVMKGWRRMKRKEIYLYGLKPILHYRKKDYEIHYHFRLACRSTLNGAWVPLDRCINVSALENVVIDVNTGFRVLAADDAVCYLLADCIYTRKCFPYDKRKIILRKMEEAGNDVLNEKLSKIFFKFSEKLLDMVRKEAFNEIIPMYYAFGEY